MRIGVYCDHVGSSGIQPSGQYGGGELLTLGYLHVLNEFYDVIPIINNGVYPSFDNQEEYGLPQVEFNWKPVGDNLNWVRNFDVFINISHGRILPPMCYRNILVVMFPQHPEWDVSGYDTIISISDYTAQWVKKYWGRDSYVVYPPLPVKATAPQEVKKYNEIVSVGRFFRVPGGNNKQHEIIIKSFQNLVRADWKLKLIGSVQDSAYYNELRAIVGNDDRISFLHDLSREEYIKELASSRFLWAATGYNTIEPSSREHFGIIAVEAMACGTIPIVHNSGGTPETGALTWDTPNELVDTTKELIEDEEKWMSTIQGLMGSIGKFDISNTKPLIDVIEAPVTIESDPNKGKIYSDYPSPNQVKIGVISDSPNATLGFGINTRALVARWLDMGFRVAAFGRHDPPGPKPKLPPEDILSMFHTVVNDEMLVTPQQQLRKLRQELANKGEICTIWRDPRDGWDGVVDFIKSENPDVMYLNYDIGNIRGIIDTLRSAGEDFPPFVAYFPVEGVPVLPQYLETIRLIRLLNGIPVTYTSFGANAIAEAGGPRLDYVWHGGDHAKFRVLPSDHVAQLKFAVGWHDKFVCMFVGRNKRTKGILNLFEAARLLKNMGRDDIMFYIHSWPYDRMPNSSAPLDEIVHTMGISEMVTFPDEFNQIDGKPYDGEIQVHAEETDDLDQIRKINLRATNMIELFNMADLYTNCSEIEGFGLPLVEAMGCGLPILSVDDQAAQREVLGDAAMYIPVAHWDRFHTGAKLAQFNPESMARAIDELSKDQETLNEFGAKALERYQMFKWGNAAEFLADKIMEQVLL